MPKAKRIKKPNSLAEQVKEKVKKKKKNEVPNEDESAILSGNFEKGVISTGSTLLDLAISGNRIRGGGIPAGTMFICYGPSQSGKTALLSQIAGNILKKKGEVYFNDPEARLDQEFSSMFGMRLPSDCYKAPDTVTEVFEAIREWKPSDTENKINGIITDSLAALSTKTEMENKEGDKMGGRRSKEFSEGLRKHARIIKNNNYIFACSNQIREKMNAQPFESKVEFPGGKALWFYASIVVRFNNPSQIKTKVKIHGKEEVRATGIEVTVTVEKTVDTPYRKAPLIITFGYGIDDIRANLEYVKKYKGNSTYTVKGESVGNGLEKAILYVEKNGLEKKLKNEVIDLWAEVESKFQMQRKPKEL